jgi:hypothetical protein
MSLMQSAEVGLHTLQSFTSPVPRWKMPWCAASATSTRRASATTLADPSGRPTRRRFQAKGSRNGASGEFGV